MKNKSELGVILHGTPYKTTELKTSPDEYQFDGANWLTIHDVPLLPPDWCLLQTCLYTRLGETLEIPPRVTITADLLHRRLGHLHPDKMRRLIKSVPNLHVSHRKRFDKSICDVCVRSKLKSTRVKRTNKTKPDRAGDLIYADLKGLSYPDIHGNTYLLIMVDAATKLWLIYPLKSKADVLTAFQSLIHEFNAHFGPDDRVRVIQPDNEKVFVDTGPTLTWIKEQQPPIRLRPNPPHKKQRHGGVERPIGVLLDLMRSMANESRVDPYMFASDLAITAAYVHNLTPHASLDFLSPYTRLTGHTTPVHHLRVFGSKVWFKDQRRPKSLEDRTRPGILIGYGHHSSMSVYKVFTLDTFQVIYTEDCVVDETTVPDLTELESTYEEHLHSDDDLFVPEDTVPLPSSPPARHQELDRVSELGRVRGRAPDDAGLGSGLRLGTKPVPPPKVITSLMDLGRTARSESALLATGDRVRVPLSVVASSESDTEFLYGTITSVLPSRCYQVDLDEASPLPRPVPHHVLTKDETMASLYACLKSENVLTHWKAMKNPDLIGPFTEAQASEWNDLRFKYKVLSDYVNIKDVPPDAQIIHLFWNLEIKPDRPLAKRYKARCLAKGDEEDKSDGLTTYAPTATKESFRLLLAIAQTRSWRHRVVDIKSAFLNTDMSNISEARETYFVPPPGYRRKGYLVKKLSSLYGLATAPRYWWLTFERFMLHLGYEQASSDECLFLRYTAERKLQLALVVHVDDLYIVGTKRTVNTFVDTLREKWTLRDLGFEPNKYLGMNLTHTPEGHVILHQEDYITSVCQKFLARRATNSRIRTPLVGLLVPPPDGTINAVVPYRSLVGALLYISICTRPDISFTVMHLSRFLTRHTMLHYNAAIRCLQYLQNTSTRGIWYRRSLGPTSSHLVYTQMPIWPMPSMHARPPVSSSSIANI